MDSQRSATIQQGNQVRWMRQRLSPAEGNASLGAIHKNRLFLDLTHDLVDRILTAGHLHRQGGTNLGASTACPAQRPIRDDTRLRQGQRPGGAGIHAGPATYALLSRIQLLRPGRDAFRVMAPYAGKRASLHEDRDTDARPVVYGVSFDIE